MDSVMCRKLRLHLVLLTFLIAGTAGIVLGAVNISNAAVTSQRLSGAVFVLGGGTCLSVFILWHLQECAAGTWWSKPLKICIVLVIGVQILGFTALIVFRFRQANKVK